MKQWLLVLLSFILAGAFSSANAQQGTAAWSRRAGANLTDQASAVATDVSGNVYVTGSFSGINASFGNGITQNSSGSEDIFLAKYLADGNTQWVRVAGASGTNADRGRSVSVDAAGNVYVAGFFEGTAIFPNTTLVSNGLRDGFIAKYDANGNFLWARRVGGVGRDEAYDVATDATGNVYVVGQFQNSINIGTTTLNSNGDFDFFVARWDGNGNPTWAIGGGGQTADLAAAVATDGNDVIVTGNFDGIASFELNNPAFQRTSQGSFDAFVASYNATTGAANWVNIGGGASADYSNDVVIERATGAIYTTGRFVGQGRFFGIQPNPFLITSVNSSDDIFLTKYNRTGEILWAKSAGSPNSDFGNALALDNAGAVYVAGQFQNTATFATGFTTTSRGNYDLFLARYDASGNVNFAKGYGTTSLDVATGVNVFGGATYLVGYFNGSIMFDNNPLLTSPGLSDIFAARLNFDVQPCNLASPSISAAAPANCAQQLTATHPGSASTYNWYRNGLLITNVNTASISAAEAGTYAVEYLSGNCISQRSLAVNVAVANNLSVNASANPLSVNAGQTSTLSVNVTGNTGATTITWRDDAGNPIGSGASVSVTVNRTTSYTAQVTDNTSGCTRTGLVTVTVQQTGNCRTDGDVVVTIIPGNDNVPSTPNIAEICIGQSTGLEAVGFAGNTNFTYTWIRETPSGNVVVRQGVTRIESIVIDGIYRLQVTSPGCPVATSNAIQVITYQVPSVVVSSNQVGNQCAQGNVILSATASGGTPFTVGGTDIEGGYKYRWEPANAIIGTNITRVVTVNPAIATTFTVTAEDAITCGRNAVISVNPGIPTISISPDGQQTVCTGNNVAFTAFINGTPTVNQSVRWYRNGVVIPGATGNAFTATQNGTYIAEIFDRTNNCFNRSNQANVTIVGQVNANAGGNRSICAGTATQLGSTAVAGASYMWMPNDGSLSNMNVSNPIARPMMTTVYTLTVQVQNCPATTSTVTVNVDQPVTAPMIMANGSAQFCEGGSVVLSVVNPMMGISYRWFMNGISVGNTGSNYTATMTGSYSVQAEGIGSGACANPLSNTIDVASFRRENLPIPKIRQFGSATLAICNNNAVRLWTDRTPNYNYSWFKDGVVIPGANDTTFSATEPGVYHVAHFRGNEGDVCSSSKSEGVFITRSNVAPPTVISDGNRMICRESNVCLKFKATTGHPNKKIMWDWTPKTAVVSTKMTNDSLELCVKPLSDVTYTVMVKDDFGCMAEVPATVSIKAIPAPFISGQTICHNGSITIPRPNEAGYTFWRLWRRVVNRSTANINTNYDIAGSPFAQVQNVNQDEYRISPGSISLNQVEQFVLEASVEGCGMEYSNILNLDVVPCPTIGGVSGAAYCDNRRPNSLVLTATGVSGNTYAGVSGQTPTLNWNVNGITRTTTGNSSITLTGNDVPAGGMNDVIVTVSNNNILGVTASASNTITVVPAHPAFTLTAPSLVACAGEAVTLSPSIFNTQDYNYTLNGAAIDPSNIVVNPTVNTTYNLVATPKVNVAGCGASGSATVRVNALPVVTALTKAICYGDKIELWSNSTVPAGGSYSWELLTDGGGSISIPTTRVGTASNPNVLMADSPYYPPSALAESATYRLTFTNANGCTSSATAVVSFVKAGPEARVRIDRPMICAGDTTFITGLNAGQISTALANPNNLSASNRYIYYRWNGPATMNNPTGLLASGLLEINGAVQAGNVDARTIKALRVWPLSTTTYTLTLTNGLNECVSTCEATVQVGPRLVATVRNVTGNENICAGEVVLEAISNTNAQGTPIGVSYQWYTDIDGENLWVMIPGATGKTFRPTSGGRYNVKVWLGGMEGCYDYGDRWHTIVGVDGNAAQSNDLVTVLKDGDAVIQKEPAIICAGDRIELTARYIFGAAYQWYSVTGPRGREQYRLIDGAVDRDYVTGASGKYVVNVIAGCDTCPDACEIWSQICPVVVLQELKPTVMHNGQIELCNDVVDGKPVVNHVELYTQGMESQYAYQWYRNGTMIEGETRNRIITSTDGRYSVEVRPRFTPYNTGVEERYCRRMSENMVDVKRCSTGFCPKPISVRGVLNPETPTTAQIRWDQPLNDSQYNLTGNYYVTLRQGNTTIFADRLVRNAKFLNVTNLSTLTDYSVCVVTECSRPARMSDTDCNVFRTYAGTGGGGGGTACEALNQPNNGFIFTDVTTTSFVVSWSPVANVENRLLGYQIDLQAEGGPIQENILRVDNATTSANIGVSTPALTPNTNYTVWVRPFCDANEAKDRVISDNVLTLPSSNGSTNDDFVIALFVTDLDENTANIGWTPITNATSYDVRWSVAGSGTVLGTENGTTNTNVVINGLTAGTTYEVSVRANITGRTTDFSAPIVFTTRARGNTCARPNISSVEGTCVNGSHQYIINWLDPATEPGVGYVVNWRRRGDSNVIESSIKDPLSRTDTIGGMLTDNGIFDIDVVAICDGVTRDSASVVIFTRNCSGGKLAGNAGVESLNYNIYPNPTNGVYNVAFSAAQAGNVTLKMVDATGRVVFNQTVNTVSGENNIPVNANVTAGIYMLQIQNGSTLNTAKIVVE